MRQKPGPDRVRGRLGVAGAGGNGAEVFEVGGFGGGLLSASTTTLAEPEVWRKSEVKSERFDICLCYRAYHGGVTWPMAATIFGF